MAIPLGPDNYQKKLKLINNNDQHIAYAKNNTQDLNTPWAKGPANIITDSLGVVLERSMIAVVIERSKIAVVTERSMIAVATEPSVIASYRHIVALVDCHQLSLSRFKLNAFRFSANLIFRAANERAIVVPVC